MLISIAPKAEDKLKMKHQSNPRGRDKQVAKGPKTYTPRKRIGNDEFVGCFKCGLTGHRAFECKKVLMLQGELVADTVMPEAGENLMVRRVLVNQCKVDPRQRRSLFRTICKCGGKCCMVIVDGGSTDNLVFEEMVQKLGLKRLRHPCPYKISWLQDEHALEVREKCLLNFEIVPYVDQVLCHVVNMSTCHLLLGRPW